MGRCAATYSTFDRMKSVGLPGFAAAEEEDDSEMQPLSSDDDAESHSTEAALE